MKKLGRGIILVVLILAVLCAETITYTAKDKVSVQGRANRNVGIEVYVNNRMTVMSQTDDNGNWTAYDVPLQLNARNDIYAIAVAPDGTRSKTSTKLTVVVDTTAPNFVSAVFSPPMARPDENVKITARTERTAASVSVELPDRTTLSLKAGSNNTWTGNWRVPQTTAAGKYSATFTAANRLGTTSETQAELAIDLGTTKAQAEPPVATPPVAVLPIAVPGSLTIAYPTENAIFYEDSIRVGGTANNITQVEIGLDRAVVQADGFFTGNFRVPKPGRNLLTVSAVDLAGNRVEQKVTIVRLITFSDIQGHWAKSEIEYLATLGYIQAYPNTNIYAPERNITRAELAALLVRARQLPESFTSNGRTVFKDIQSNYWASGYIETAARQGLVEGYPGRVYKPSNFVTRAEAAAMFSRYTNGYSAPANAYADVPANHWASPQILAFKNSGLTPRSWQNQQRFLPDQPITRAELAAILARVKDINRDIEVLLGRNPNLEIYTDTNPYTGPASLPQSAAFAPPAEAGTALPNYDTFGYAYPEDYTKLPVAPAVFATTTTSGELTRAQAAGLLAKYHYLKQAIVNVPPAKDVPLTHPQVKAIKSAIVTGIIPNKSAGTFAPGDRVSYAEAANILRRAKISASVSGSGYISAAEFERKIAR